jgi:large repetitive protein
VATVTLTWTAPTTRVDGSPLAPEQIAGTHVFDGASEIGAVQGAANTFTTGALSAGEHSFTVVVHDTDGNLSAPSNVAAATIGTAAPAAVTDLKAVVNV